jgi:hypothetical protein
MIDGLLLERACAALKVSPNDVLSSAIVGELRIVVVVRQGQKLSVDLASLKDVSAPESIVVVNLDGFPRLSLAGSPGFQPAFTPTVEPEPRKRSRRKA